MPFLMLAMPSQDAVAGRAADRVLRAAAPACVQVRSYGRTMTPGTGFLLGSRRVVVTSARVVAGASRNVVIDSSGEAHRAVGLVKDAANDVAVLLLAEELDASPLTAGTDPEIGAEAYTVGHPIGALSAVLTSGVVRPHERPERRFSLSFPVASGSAGAPVLGADGTLLGMALPGDAARGSAIPVSLVAAVARRAADTAGPDATTIMESDEVIDDPSDANGEFAPARESIENARKGRPEVIPAAPVVLPDPPVAVEPPVVAVNPRLAATRAFARYYGGLWDARLRWYLDNGDERRVRDHLADGPLREALISGGLYDPLDLERAIDVLDGEVTEVAAALEAYRAEPGTEAFRAWIAADRRLLHRAEIRLRTADARDAIDRETYLREASPALLADAVLARFHAWPDPRAELPEIALSYAQAFGERGALRRGDVLTALVVGGSAPIPVASLRDLGLAFHRSNRQETALTLVVRRAGRTLLVEEPARR